MARELSERDVAQIALDAGVDVRTVRRTLDGTPNRSRATRAAIVAALKKHRFFAQASELADCDDNGGSS